jgi:hypothetical protein
MRFSPFSKMAAVLLAATMTTFVSGCEDEPAAPSRNPISELLGQKYPWDISNADPNYGYIYASARTVGTGDPRYETGAQVFSSTSHTTIVDGGTATAAGVTMTYNGDTVGYTAHFNSPTFGSSSAWGLTGNSGTSTPTFTDSLYLPAVIKLSSPSTTGSSLDNDNSVTVAWNSDSHNDTVFIAVRFDRAMTFYVDSTISGTTYTYSTKTNDDGSFTIPSSVLQNFPVNGYIEIAVARGNSKASGTSTRPYHIFGYTSSTNVFKVVD